MPTCGRDRLLVRAVDLYELTPDAEVLAADGGLPCVWRKGVLIFVAVRGMKNDDQLPDWLFRLAGLAD